MIIELNEKALPVFDEIMEALRRYPEFEYIQIKGEATVSLPGLETLKGGIIDYFYGPNHIIDEENTCYDYFNRKCGNSN